MIEGESFTGQPGKTKKQAEMSAAKVAYTTLIERTYTKANSLILKVSFSFYLHFLICYNGATGLIFY